MVTAIVLALAQVVPELPDYVALTCGAPPRCVPVLFQQMPGDRIGALASRLRLARIRLVGERGEAQRRCGVVAAFVSWPPGAVGGEGFGLPDLADDAGASMCFEDVQQLGPVGQAEVVDKAGLLRR